MRLFHETTLCKSSCFWHLACCDAAIVPRFLWPSHRRIGSALAHKKGVFLRQLRLSDLAGRAFVPTDRRGSYSVEGGTAVAAHIHFSARRVNGGGVAFLCGGGGKPACPATEGTVTGVIHAADIIGPLAQGIEPGAFEEFVAAIRAGFTYANVHSARWPNGEIRGQIRGEDDDH